jgi:diacylglycerol kinase (ATP)
VQTTTGRSIDVRLNHRLPYELDGGDRKATKKLKIKVKPEAVTIAVPDENADE